MPHALALALVLDLIGDGTRDTVRLVQGKKSITVSVTYGNRKLATDRLTFTVDPGRQDAICKLPARLEAEPIDYAPPPELGNLEGFVRSKKAMGFRVVDGACDSLHFFWNHKAKHIEWWRL